MVDIDCMQVMTFSLVSQIWITVQVRITIESSIPRFGFGRFCVLNLIRHKHYFQVVAGSHIYEVSELGAYLIELSLFDS